VILGPSLLRCACACSERSRAWLPADPVPTHSHRQGRRSVDGERLASVQHNSQGQGRRKVWTGSAWQACSTTAKGAAPPPREPKQACACVAHTPAQDKGSALLEFSGCTSRVRAQPGPHDRAGERKYNAKMFRVHEQGACSAWPVWLL